MGPVQHPPMGIASSRFGQHGAKPTTSHSPMVFHNGFATTTTTITANRNHHHEQQDAYYHRKPSNNATHTQTQRNGLKPKTGISISTTIATAAEPNQKYQPYRPPPAESYEQYQPYRSALHVDKSRHNQAAPPIHRQPPSVDLRREKEPATTKSIISPRHPGTITNGTTNGGTNGSSTSGNVSPAANGSVATVLVGQHQQSFKVDKRLLCATSPFFRDRLEDPTQRKPVSLWLPGESPAMFGLFVAWVHSRSGFRRHLEDAAALAEDSGDKAVRDLNWALIRLHLFASQLCLYHLQDAAMDALQDLYLRCDWNVPPGIIYYLYTKCEPLPAVRLRRWAVAMVAFSLTSSAAAQFRVHLDEESVYSRDDSDQDDPNAVVVPGDSARFHALLDSLPEFAEDYHMHLRKMRGSGLDVRFKNPQLRIPANRLRNEERAFGFRECSFHSHRATVGERRCPHRFSDRAGRSRRARRPSISKSCLEYHSEEEGDEEERRLLVDRARHVKVPHSAAQRDVLAEDSEGEASDGSFAISVQDNTVKSPSLYSVSRQYRQDPHPRPLFSTSKRYMAERERAIAHVRSASSIAK